MLYVGKGSEREQCSLLHSAGFQSLPPATHKQIGPFWCWFLGGWACVHSRTLCVCPANSLGRHSQSWKFLPLPPQVPYMFLVRGLGALFPCAGTLGCTVCLASWLFLLVYLHTNVWLPSLPATTLPGPPATALLRVLSTKLPISTSSTGLDECFFFNSLFVGLPYSSIFCHFWLFFVFKFVVVLLLVVWWGTACLPSSLSCLEVPFYLLDEKTACSERLKILHWPQKMRHM